jgi:hypothetical protein
MQKMNTKLESVILIKSPNRKKMIKIIREDGRQSKETARLGILFGVIDTDLEPAKNSELLNTLSQAVERYYKSQKEYDAAFDDFMRLLNASVTDTAGICAAFGVLRERDLIFSSHGAIFAYLVSPKGVKKILPEEAGGEGPSQENNFFSHSLSGELLENYTLYFCNEEFSGAVGYQYLGSFIKKYGAEEALDSLKDNIFKIQGLSQSAALFIYRLAEKSADIKPAESILELLQSADATQNRLSPSVIKSVEYFLQKKSLPAVILAAAAKYLKIIIKIVLISLRSAAIIILNLFFIATNLRSKREEKIQAIKKIFTDAGKTAKNSFFALSLASKAALIGSILLAILLAGGITYAVQTKKTAEFRAAYTEKMSLAAKLSDEAESSMLFKDKKTAVTKLREAIATMNAVPEKVRDAAYKKRYAELSEKIQKIQNIAEVSSPIVLADFSADEKIALFPPLYIFNSEIVTASENDIIKIDIKSANVKWNPLKIKRWNGLTSYYSPQKTLYSFDSRSMMQAINLSNLVSELKEIVLQTNEDPKDFAVYNDKAYILSYDAKQFYVWKHNPSITGFGRPTLWTGDGLRENSTPLSFAIDGSLYLLYSDNTLLKYYRGQKAGWNYSVSDIPEGLRYFRVMTGDEYNNIYLTAKNGVSILSKNGDFLGHIIFPSVGEIKDIATDEKTKTLYILAGQKIYAVAYNI